MNTISVKNILEDERRLDICEWDFFNQEIEIYKIDNLVFCLAKKYHEECEAYDRTVCSGKITKDGATPFRGKELFLVNKNALNVREKIMREADIAKVNRKEVDRAIGILALLF